MSRCAESVADGAARQLRRLDSRRMSSAGPQSLPWRAKELFPRLPSGRIPECRVVVTTADPVMPRAHIDTPAARQIICRLEFGQHDCVVPQCRTDHSIASPQ
jgi:hypothetical protein